MMTIYDVVNGKNCKKINFSSPSRAEARKCKHGQWIEFILFDAGDGWYSLESKNGF